jgi:large subunit ribosomal protein L22
MEVNAKSNTVRVSPRKVRLVADAIRNKSIAQAMNILSLTNKRGATVLYKTLKSVISNAVNNAKIKENMLIIKSIEIGEGPFLKRYRPSTRGRIHPYKRRSSHIRIVLETKEGVGSGAKS